MTDIFHRIRRFDLQRLPLENVTLLLAIAVLTVVFSILLGDSFLSSRTLGALGYQLPELALLSLAMMIAMIAGGLNLSVVATANLCAMTAGGVLLSLPESSSGLSLGLGIAAAFAAAFLVAGVIGAATGAIVAYLGVSPILATLGTMLVIKGLAIALAGGTIIAGFPEPVRMIGNASVVGIPAPTLVLIATFGIVAVVLLRTPFGMSLRMIGSNQQATLYSGIDTRLTVLKSYVLSSIIACLAGIVMMARFNSASPAYGESYLLITVLACVLGGVNPFGGNVKVFGLVLSLITLQIVASAFNLLNLSPFLSLASWGVLLILVSALGARRSAR